MGTLYSYAVVHHPQVPGFEAPIIVGLVELDEGVRITAHVRNVGPDSIEIGMPMHAVPTLVDGFTHLDFVPAMGVVNSKAEGYMD
jgi:uncharacterized OB-fold protein